MAITVKVGKLPGKINELALEDDATVARALEVGGLSSEGYEVRLNGEPTELDEELEEGDTLLLVKKVKGNADDYITVRVGKLPGRIESISMNGDRTVQAALGAAGLSAEGYEVRLNGEPTELDEELEEGDTLLLVKKVKGNS